MTQAARWFSTLWWLVHKDLLREYRAWHAWPATVLLGILLVLALAIHLDLPAEARLRVGGGLFWVAVFFAGALLVERSFLVEREEGCWKGLALYPISAATLFLSKLLVMLTALSLLECVLLPVFVVLADVPLLAHPGALLGLAVLVNIGFSAVGVLLGALASSVRQRGPLLVLLLLPLLMPLALGAAEGTRLLAAGQFHDLWWQWLQLLTVFAVLYVVAGAMLFEYVWED